MMQKEVRFDMPFGVPGELAVAGPVRAVPGVLNSDPAGLNVVGRYFTRGPDGTFQAGGTGADGGILANPKVYASYGDPSGTLEPTLSLPNGSICEIIQEGEVVVWMIGSVVEGDPVYYTGIGEITRSSNGTTLIPGAKVTRFAQKAAGGLAVIHLG